MEIGMIGLGRMGANMAQRLVRGGHGVVGYSRTDATRRRARDNGIKPASSIEALVKELKTPRTVWLMVPAGDAVDDYRCELASAGARRRDHRRRQL